jgi:hypothetical protein
MLRAEHLVKHFPVKIGFFGRGGEVVHAVDGVSFDLTGIRRWRWSANRAAANRRSAGWCCGCSSPRAARSGSTASISARCPTRR